MEPRFHGELDHWALALEVYLVLRERSYLNENGREQLHFISKGIPPSFHRQNGQPAWLPCRSALSAHYWPYALIQLTSFSWSHQHRLLHAHECKEAFAPFTGDKIKLEEEVIYCREQSREDTGSSRFHISRQITRKCKLESLPTGFLKRIFSSQHFPASNFRFSCY